MELRLTPSLLAWLRCFEAVVRHGSFTRAAADLCISQGAVSQQVKQLEQALGRALLIRHARGLTPTPQGQWLGGVLSESFGAIEGTLGQLRKPAEDQPIALSCSPSFAMRWLTPRLGDFMRDHPGVGLRVFGEFHALDRSRMVRDGVEAAVRFDPGGYTDLLAVTFLDEWLLPLASPAFVAAHPELRRPADLRGAMLLHDVSPWEGAGEFEEWETWLAAAGVKPPAMGAGQRFNLSQLAVGAALAGQGVVMGRTALVLEDVEAGRLVDLFGLAVPSRASYHFVHAKVQETRIGTVERWLLDEGERFRRERRRVLPTVFASTRRAAKSR
jgi:DNA-binding transcriptional LysR family regulator